MMKTKFVLLSLITVLLLNCKNKTKNEIPISSENKEVIIEESTKLRFDNEQKWLANKETHTGIENMDSIIKVFKSQASKDYIILGEALSKQTGFIIKNCTMKGESHDQLHVILVPMLDEISILRESESKDNSENVIGKLESLIKDYFIYFKI